MIRLLLILSMVLIGLTWLARPQIPPDMATLAAAQDPLVHHSRSWTPVGRATVTPGARTFIGEDQCTANFVFSDRAGNLYLGQAAHCSEADRVSNGCRARSRPLGTPVAITQGKANIGMGQVVAWGTLAYSSWVTMQRRHDHVIAQCAFNDFALIRLKRSDRHLVNPSLPFWGGPEGLADHEVATGEKIYGFGHSELRKAGSTGSRQSAITIADLPQADGWSHSFVAESPGIPGDSGSGYLDSSGDALGTLSSLRISYALINAIGDLHRELTYARKYSGLRGLRLELGTMPFDPYRPVTS